MPIAPPAIWKKVAVVYIIGIIVVALALFVPAGTLDYWQAWVYIAILFVPVFFAMLHFLLTDPEFIERRMQFRERVKAQSLIITLANIVFFIGFLIPGLDRRFGWSSVPFEVVVGAQAIVFLGYVFCFLALNENRWASRTIGVEKGQTVVSTGPYAIVRHPLYLGQMVMFLSTPIALGSYWGVIPFILVEVLVVFRILNEEEVLRRELPGYVEYCKRTRYRLLPFVW